MTKAFKFFLNLLILVILVAVCIGLCGKIKRNRENPSYETQEYRTEWGRVVDVKNGEVIVLTPKDGEMWSYKGEAEKGDELFILFDTFRTNDLKDDAILRVIG